MTTTEHFPDCELLPGGRYHDVVLGDGKGIPCHCPARHAGIARADRTLSGLRCGDRTAAEIAKNEGLTQAEAQAALDDLVAANRAVIGHWGGYLPYRPDLGDTLWHDAKGRLIGVRTGRAHLEEGSTS